MDELHGTWIVSHKAVTQKQTNKLACHLQARADAKKPAGSRSERAWLTQVASKGHCSPNIPTEGTGEVKTT